MKKFLALVLGIGMALGGLTGCGPKAAGDSQTASLREKDGQALKGGTAGETQLTMWSWSPISRTAKKMIADFEKENPGIKIAYTNYNYDPEYLTALSSAAASNHLPDIIGLQPGALTQQYADYLIDLSAYAQKTWGDDWKDKFYKIASEQIQLGNKTGDNNYYLMPVEAQIIFVEYNKKMFERLGIKVPRNYEELKAAAKILAENGKAPLFEGGANAWQNINIYLMLLSQIDTKALDKAQQGEIPWTDSRFVRAMTNWKKLFTDGIFQVGALSASCYPDGVNAFTSGNAGMIALGSWWGQEFTAPDAADTIKNWDFDYFYLPPVETGLKSAAPIGGIDFGYGITKNCKKPEAAWKALKSFSSGAGIQACVNDLNNLPAMKGIEPKGKINQNLLEQYDKSTENLDSCMNQRIGRPEVSTALGNALAAVAAGQLPPEKALQTVQDAQKKAK